MDPMQIDRSIPWREQERLQRIVNQAIAAARDQISYTHASHVIGCSVQRVQALVAEGRLEKGYHAGHPFVLLSEVEEYIRQRDSRQPGRWKRLLASPPTAK